MCLSPATGMSRSCRPMGRSMRTWTRYWPARIVSSTPTCPGICPLRHRASAGRGHLSVGGGMPSRGLDGGWRVGGGRGRRQAVGHRGVVCRGRAEAGARRCGVARRGVFREGGGMRMTQAARMAANGLRMSALFSYHSRPFNLPRRKGYFRSSSACRSSVRAANWRKASDSGCRGRCARSATSWAISFICRLVSGAK